MFKRNRLFTYIFLTTVFITGTTTARFVKAQDNVPIIKTSENLVNIKGKVIDATTGQGIPAANVSVSDIAAAITDESGRFIIQIPSKDYSLLISAPGYGTKYVALQGKDVVEVHLYEEGYSEFYGRVMLPHGEDLKAHVPYSVVSINTNGAWNTSNETTDSYFQGKAAGLESLRKSGSPDIGANLYLRGYNSLYANNQPLVIVDGMLFDTRSYGSSLINGYENNPLSTIDIKDIDNITVIKDAVSMYGTKGANGVILITTAKAKDVATRLNFGAYGGYNIAGDNIPVLGANDYRAYLSDILKSKGLSDGEINDLPYMSNLQMGDYFNYHQNTNWQNLVKDDGSSQNYYLKVTGGDDIATYALSLGYLSNKGTVTNTNYNRYQTRFNADLNLTKKLKGHVNLSFSRNERDLNHQGLDQRLSPLYTSLVKAPFLSSYIVDENNISSPNLSYSDLFGVSNPKAIVSDNMISKINGYRFMGGISLGYEFSKKLSLNTLFGLTFDKGRENLFVPEIGIAPINLQSEEGYNAASASVQRLFSLYTDTYLSYKKVFMGNNKFQANVGFRYNSNESEYDTALAYNTASDDFVTLNAGQATLRTIGGSLGKWNWLNTYANLNYISKDKYFLTVNLAADASSRFGSQIKDAFTINNVNYAFLPSISGAWLLSSEDFMANTSFVDNLKLRASYGLVGNDDIGNYTSKSYYVSQNFLGRQGLLRGNIANPEIKWETNTKFNVGIDAALLKERLSLSLDFYNHSIKDMIVYEPVLEASGFNYMITNGGGMKNSGVELGLSGRLFNQNSFKLDLGFTVARNKNEVTQLPNGQIITDYNGAIILSEVGQEANLFYGYKSNGVYLSDQQAQESGISHVINGQNIAVTGGDVRFVDVNNDKNIDLSDRQVIGNPNPDFIGSFFTAAKYKRWSLDALFTFSVGNDIYNAVRANIESLNDYNNQSISALNRWRIDGHVTDIPKAAWGDPMQNSRFSDRWIEDGSYLRLRTISLNYNVPIKNSIIRNASVYAIANNLFTVTNYLGFDPEFSANTNIFARGVDVGLNPQYKAVQLGLRIGL